jgi:hypothetical protein
MFEEGDGEGRNDGVSQGDSIIILLRQERQVTAPVTAQP